MDLELKGRTVLVTGEASGSARPSPCASRGKGRTSCLCARNQEPLLQAQREIEDLGAAV